MTFHAARAGEGCITVVPQIQTVSCRAFSLFPRVMSAPASKSTAPPKPAARKVPEKIGKYVVIKEVGRGSTGIVYLSHDAYYGRDVAIKVYNIETGGDEERARISRKMFLSEAHLVGM